MVVEGMGGWDGVVVVGDHGSGTRPIFHFYGNGGPEVPAPPIAMQGRPSTPPGSRGEGVSHKMGGCGTPHFMAAVFP